MARTISQSPIENIIGRTFLSGLEAGADAKFILNAPQITRLGVWFGGEGQKFKQYRIPLLGYTPRIKGKWKAGVETGGPMGVNLDRPAENPIALRGRFRLEFERLKNVVFKAEYYDQWPHNTGYFRSFVVGVELDLGSLYSNTKDKKLPRSPFEYN